MDTTRATVMIIRTNLLEYPVVKAWSALRPGQGEPASLEILKEGQQKSAIYRLEGVGTHGSAVIAKRCRTATGLIERIVYEQVLPRLPITAPHYYGFVEENDECCWLFLEDVGMERFSPLVAEHRSLAAQWLGLMHTAATRLAPAAHLPDRGPNHYLAHLQAARRTILDNLTNPALHTDDRAVLEAVVSQCEILEAHWQQVEKFCEQMPSTLVHGDFRPKNVRVRTTQAGIGLFPIDWETAGWGVPGADLAPARRRHSAPQVDLAAYWSIVRECWPSLDMLAMRRLVRVGFVFRRLAAIHWASMGLAYEWTGKPVGLMRVYQADLSEILPAAPWAQ